MKFDPVQFQALLSAAQGHDAIFGLANLIAIAATTMPANALIARITDRMPAIPPKIIGRSGSAKPNARCQR